jgi:hypothetical protein
MDTIDQSDETETRLQKLRIQAICKSGRELNPMGACHWCRDRFESGSKKLFCNSDCSADYERGKR